MAPDARMQHRPTKILGPLLSLWFRVLARYTMCYAQTRHTGSASPRERERERERERDRQRERESVCVCVSE